MKKKIRTLLLLIVILSAAAIFILVVLGYWAFHSEQTSFPNRLWQYLFWKVPLIERMFLINPGVRKSLGFVYFGDDKYDFLTNVFYKKILVEIDHSTDLDVSPTVTSAIKETIFSLNPAKEVEVVISDEINGAKAVDEINLEIQKDFFAKYRSFYSRGKTKALHLVLLSKESPFKIASAGATRGSDTIIATVEKDLYPDLRDLRINLIFAHELGHLVGLRHLGQAGCVMQPILFQDYGENYHYCQDELDRVRKIQNPPLIRLAPYPGLYYSSE